MLDTQITRFNNYYDLKGAPVTLREALYSTEYRNQIDRIREMNSKEDRDNAKTMLPCYFISCVSSGREVGQHTGLLVIEWDRGVGDWLHFIDWLKQFDFILFAGLSVSGRGVFAVIPIAYPECHHAHFKALQEHFESAKVPIDPTGSNVNRLRGISFNDESTSFTNVEAKKYTGLVYAQTSNRSPITQKSPTGRFRNYINLILVQKLNVTEGYDNWIRIGLAIASEYGEAGRESYHMISSIHKEYKREITDRKYSSFLRGPSRVGLGTFYHICDRFKSKVA